MLVNDRIQVANVTTLLAAKEDAGAGVAPGDAVDDTINFDNGSAQGEFQVYWQTAFKTP